MSSLAEPPITAASSFPVEQRLFLRKKLPLPLPIELFPGKEVWLDNVGEGGLCVSGSSPLEPGSTTFLRFDFPPVNASIEAAGVVAWYGSGRAGIRFTRIRPDSSAALKRWLTAPIQSAVKKFHSSEALLRKVEEPSSGVAKEIATMWTEINAKALPYAAALGLIAERLVKLTRAGGAAIALAENGDVVCKASAGSAPPIGAKLELGSTLTGECYRSGNIVTVADAASDGRIHEELKDSLSFRSLLIVPVKFQDDSVGIAEVLSAASGNFDSGDVLLLCSVAELIGELFGENFKP